MKICGIHWERSLPMPTLNAKFCHCFGYKLWSRVWNFLKHLKLTENSREFSFEEVCRLRELLSNLLCKKYWSVERWFITTSKRTQVRVTKSEHKRNRCRTTNTDNHCTGKRQSCIIYTWLVIWNNLKKLIFYKLI